MPTTPTAPQRTRHTPRYYVRLDTYWQNSPDRFVGPFATRAEAEQAITAAVDAPRGNVWFAASGCGGDIKDAIRIYGVLTFSAARRLGLYELRDTTPSSNIIGTRIPLNMAELKALEEPLYAY